MTPQQFAEGPATSDLLTQSEKFAILINISSPSTDIPMPAGFTTCRVPRIKRVFAIDDTAVRIRFLLADNSINRVYFKGT